MCLGGDHQEVRMPGLGPCSAARSTLGSILHLPAPPFLIQKWKPSPWSVVSGAGVGVLQVVLLSLVSGNERYCYYFYYYYH